MASNYIAKIEINGLWGKYNIKWDNLHSDVNILVGINGSGKSTLLNILHSIILHDNKSLQKQELSYAKIEFENSAIIFENGTFKTIPAQQIEDSPNVTFINTFDVPIASKTKLRKDESPLMYELRNLILQTGSDSFNDYRLGATKSPKKAKEINFRIATFFEQIDKLFVNTGKKIDIDNSNKVVFKLKDQIIELEQLSSGEKQLLYILFKVFLMNELPCVLLMDEPELSLHIGWQQELIDALRGLNPKCQLIIATHSPSIFGKGWGEKVTKMDHLFQK